MAISVASRKAKGRRLQQLVAKDFSNITGIPYGKDELIESREMGQAGNDIKLIGEAKRLLNVAVECKAQEKWSIHSFLNQATANLGNFEDWVLICKKSRKKPIVFISEKYSKKLNICNNCRSRFFKYKPTKAWRVDKWIDECHQASTSDLWAASASKPGEEIVIFMDYSYYVKLLTKLVSKR